jgi:hypothetical protein
MMAFLLGCVPFALGGLVATWVWRKALDAEQRGEPSGLRILSGLVVGANVYTTIALLLWEHVQWPLLGAMLLLVVAPPVSLVVLVVAVFRQRDIDIAVWALGSAAITVMVFLAHPPLA